MQFDYDLAVIGAGTAGMTSALIADSLGAKVALIEADKVGGDHLWRGCIPSKTLVKSAKVFDLIKRSEEFGVHVEKPRMVWNAVKLRIADVRDEIRKNQREKLANSKIEQIAGRARFVDVNHLEIESKGSLRTVSAKKFIVATGAKPHIPIIEGLEEAGYITTAGLFERATMPKTLVFIGVDGAAVEMAQAFSRFGTKVTVLQREAQLLPQEEPEISALMQKLLENEGIQIYLNAQPTRVETGESQNTVYFLVGEEELTAKSATIVVAAGKTPNSVGLTLENAGVETSEQGITVDAFLRTSANNIWACGDVKGHSLCTQAAEYEGKIAAQNALLPVGTKADFQHMPWVIFTDPEIAHLGLTQREAQEKHGSVKVWRAPFNQLDRAIIEGETSGFAHIVTTASGVIVGAHIIGPSAGELISSFIPAVRSGTLLQKFAEAIFPAPTLSQIGHKIDEE